MACSLSSLSLSSSFPNSNTSSHASSSSSSRSLVSSSSSSSTSSFRARGAMQFSTTSMGWKMDPMVRNGINVVKAAMTLDFSGSFFEDGIGEEGSSFLGGGGSSSVGLEEKKEELQCPPGCRQYETMAVLRPDMSEDERISLTERYEELMVAGGAMYVEVFNRGVIPLAYPIKKRNREGETNTYMDGIYLLFTYFTKPESMDVLEKRMKTDDDVIRYSSFKVRKRKLY